MRLLVTGGAGFIGSNFVRYWADAHGADHVVAYDVLTYAGDRRNLTGLEDRVELVEADCCDLEAATGALRSRSIDVVVHFAAESHNSLSVLDPGLFFRANVIGTQTSLEAARKLGGEWFHNFCPDQVYGDLPLDTDTASTE